MNGEAMVDRLPFFVYGTLLPGQPNAFLWGSGVVDVASAEIEPACLYDMGHYPMLIEASGRVRGAVMQVDSEQYEAVLARLDELEGYDSAEPEASEYVRVARTVEVNGRLLNAWVYVGATRFVTGCRLVPDGDWVAYVSGKDASFSDWWTSVHTVRGLHGKRSHRAEGGDV